jgi:hypothetical protein
MFTRAIRLSVASAVAAGTLLAAAGAAYRSADFTPKGIGRYRWRATYSGKCEQQSRRRRLQRVE